MDVRKRAKVNQAGSSLGILPPGSSGERCSSGKRTEPARIREGVFPLGRSGSFSGSYLPRRWPWQRCVSMAAGLFLAVLLAVAQAWCVNAIHENLLWFSQLTEVEREISFRTECGLYYSYYKQMLQAPSIQEGLSELIHDNLTESKRTINLLQRMNIYQEVFLSVLYRLLPLQAYLEPVYFYIYTVFSLQAVYVIALYLTAWLLAGSWLAGLLTGVWYILNRVDTTRVEFTISLRENWSLPFFALQVTAVTCYLRPQLSALQRIILKVMVWLMYVTTCCFCLTWQFNQFILLVQALIVYILDIVDLLTTTQVTTLYLVQVSGLLSVWLLQFCNSMILGSLVLSFIIWPIRFEINTMCFVLQPDLKTGGLLVRLAKVLLHSILVLLLAFIINSLTKKALQLRSDEHIFKFIKSKFALGPTRDFDASLYLCEEAFGLLPLDTLERLAGTLLLYPYVPTVLLLSGMLAVAVLHNLRYVMLSGKSFNMKTTVSPFACLSLLMETLDLCILLSCEPMRTFLRNVNCQNGFKCLLSPFFLSLPFVVLCKCLYKYKYAYMLVS
uniref:Uncharacterized protein n=1 Tax=Xiphophorus couchianus TaxID=32473 RepID=A0A3B5M2T2_9TELE